MCHLPNGHAYDVHDASFYVLNGDVHHVSHPFVVGEKSLEFEFWIRIVAITYMLTFVFMILFLDGEIGKHD